MLMILSSPSAERDVLEKEIKPMLVTFLAERGLELSEEKTLITHIDDGFDFLGFNVRKYNNVLLIKPSKKCVKKFLDSIRYTIESNKSCTQETMIRLLNPKITDGLIIIKVVYHQRFFRGLTTKFIANYGSGQSGDIRKRVRNGC